MFFVKLSSLTPIKIKAGGHTIEDGQCSVVVFGR